MDGSATEVLQPRELVPFSRLLTLAKTYDASTDTCRWMQDTLLGERIAHQSASLTPATFPARHL